ncbi:MAG: DNA polymerase III subunit delta [Methylomonas sp.]
MRLRIEQLGAALQKTLAPVYLVSGEEPLQLGEAADDIRQAARLAGYTTREVIAIDTGNEWHQLAAEAGAVSIFSDNKLIDLRLPSGKPGAEGGKILTNYCKHLPEDTVLLITAGKLDSAAQKTQWFQALDNVGVVIQVWPLQGQELLQWLQRRAERKGMRFDVDAVKGLAARIEGNLLAAAQEIEKLYILHGQARITKGMIEDDVADSARFDVFKLVDALLAGKVNRSVKILEGLRAEGIAAPVILWAASREARILFNIKAELRQGGHQDGVFKKYQVWDKQKQSVQDALARLKSADLQNILRICATADQQIKGQMTGDGWESLFQICLLFSKSGW